LGREDKEGNLYIGDFGNNENKREDLCIYKIAKDSLLKNTTKASYKVSFDPEQKKVSAKRRIFYMM
jgi:hypothetical protein